MGVTNENAMDEEALTVWVSAGRDQMNILRSMMDTFYLDYCKNDEYYNNIMSEKEYQDFFPENTKEALTFHKWHR